MQFDFRKLLLTKTLAVTFIILILLGNYMMVPRIFGGEIPHIVSIVFNILIYLAIIQALALVLTIIWKSYVSSEDAEDDS